MTPPDPEAFARAFTVNVTRVAELTFALVPAMVEREKRVLCRISKAARVRHRR